MRHRTLTFLRRLGLARRTRHNTEDRVDLRLPGLAVTVARSTDRPVPSELTVVVPRAEFRVQLTTPEGGRASAEVVLNSVTVVHAPRHSSAAPASPAPTLSLSRE